MKKSIKSMVNNDDKIVYQFYASIALTFLILFYMYYFFTRFSNRRITINNDDMMKTSGRYSKNLVSDTNGTIYKISSNILIFHFNSSEILDRLEAGQTYIVAGYGQRVPVLGLYPSITSIKSEI